MPNINMTGDMIIKKEQVQILEMESNDVYVYDNENFDSFNNENTITVLKEENICEFDPYYNELDVTIKMEKPKEKYKYPNGSTSKLPSNNYKLKTKDKPSKSNQCNISPKRVKITRKTKQKAVQNILYQCQFCDYSCKSRTSRYYHVKTMHTTGESSYICEECGNTFTNPSNLKAHLLIHKGGEMAHACDMCDYKSRQAGHLKRHKLAVHCKEKPFACTEPECGYKCNLKHQLESHIANNHLPNNAFSCSECEYSSKSKSLLKSHMLRHMGICKFSCCECSYKCNKLSVLEKHKLIHGKEKQYNCTSCDARFHRVYNLKLHKKIHEKRFLCNECGYKCNLKHQLESHIANNHVANNMFSCSECEYSCKSNLLLKDHMLKHTFNCSKCRFKCNNLVDFKTHILIHGKEQHYKLYNCTICYASFQKLETLKVHNNIHKGETNASSSKYSIACKICNYKFKNIEDLNKHKMSHNNE